MPTRAIGDVKLKYKEFNNHDFDPEYGYPKPIPNFTGPYISAEPDITVRKLTAEDRYLLLATDGLWDEVKRKEAAKIATELLMNPDDATKERFKDRSIPFQLSFTLCREAQQSAAKKAGVSMDFLTS
jgi:serine/threonine protein phosphatase PrpC